MKNNADLIKKTRRFLKGNKIDYLLVNSTNEFLMEYTNLSENSRYLLTNFSGSAGDAIISQKKIFLFVDGRYHEQADSEVDKNLITIVKMKMGESFLDLLEKKIKSGKTFAIVSKKVSQYRLETLQTALKKKNVEIKLLDFDPVLKEKGGKCNQEKIAVGLSFHQYKVDIKIAGLSSEEKIKKIAKKLKKGEAILVTNLEEVSYIFNLRDFSTNYSSSIRGKLLINKNGEKFLDKISTKNNVKKIYVDKTSITAHDYSLLGEKAANLEENYIKEIKAVKTTEEIEHYKKCFEKTDKTLMTTREFIEQGKNLSEYDIAENLEKNFYKFGAKSLSFKPIVAVDKNSALAHYSKNSKTEILEEGSLVLIDCGAYYEGGYATDITRVFIKGNPSKLHKKVYTVVLKGFLAAYNKKITPATSGFLLDKTARKVLNENKPPGFEFSHSLGHGIGISVHESPPSLTFSPMAKTPIKPNMCFTIEPGLYKKNSFGVRLENSCYLATEQDKLIIKSFSNMCFEEKLIDFEILSPKEKKQLENFDVK